MLFPLQRLYKRFHWYNTSNSYSVLQWLLKFQRNLYLPIKNFRKSFQDGLVRSKLLQPCKRMNTMGCGRRTTAMADLDVLVKFSLAVYAWEGVRVNTKAFIVLTVHCRFCKMKWFSSVLNTVMSSALKGSVAHDRSKARCYYHNYVEPRLQCC